MPMDRPTVIQCQAQLGDGTICGVDTPVHYKGNIPKYCDTHKDGYLRRKLALEWTRSQALAKSESTLGDDNEVAVEGEQDGGEARESPRVCRAPSCSIPLAEDWPNDFCPAHWRLLSVEARGNLANSRADWDIHEAATLRALREISVRETGVDSITRR